MGVKRRIHQTVVFVVLIAAATFGATSSATPADAAIDTPLVMASTDNYFDSRAIGTTTDRVVYVYNYGTDPIGPLVVTGGEPSISQFTMTNDCAGATLAVNANCVFTYSFSPDGDGAFTDATMFTVNGEEFEVLLAGFGVEATGTISGNVTLNNALPAAETNVYVSSLDGSTTHQFHNQPASYSVDVPPGTYCVSFGIGPWDGTLSSYPDKRHCLDDVTPVVVTSGATVTGIDATLTLASISGTLRDHEGAIVASASVYARVVAGTAEGRDETDAAGLFTIGNLPPGMYCLRSNGQTNDEANGSCPMGQRSVDLPAGSNVSGVDVTIAAPEADGSYPGAISGTVTDLAATPQAGRSVVATAYGELQYYESASTEANGTYTLTGLPAGEYCVYVTDDGTPLAGEHHADKTSCDTADPVTVGDSLVTGIDFALATGGTVTGVVTRPTGSPATAGTVRAYKVGTFESVQASLGAGGTYSIGGLSPGEYCVIASDSFGTFPARAYGGGYSCERDVTPVAVAAGGTTAGIDIQFSVGGTIAGTVTFPPGFIPGHANRAPLDQHSG